MIYFNIENANYTYIYEKYFKYFIQVYSSNNKLISNPHIKNFIQNMFINLVMHINISNFNSFILIPLLWKNVIDRLLSELAKDGFINNCKKIFLSNSLENFKNKIVLRKRNAFL